MTRFVIALFALLLWPLATLAQSSNPTVVAACGTVPAGIWIAGAQAPVTVDINGNLCQTSSGGTSSTVAISQVTPGTTNAVSIAQTNVAPATQPVTAQDAASTSTTVANGQVFVTGSPTAGSTALFPFANGFGTVRVQVTGTWTGTLVNEVSMDGGTTWVAKGLHQIGTAFTASSYTGNFSGEGAVAGATTFRVRATATWTGTATVKIIAAVSDEQVYVGNLLQVVPPTMNLFGGLTLTAATSTALSTLTTGTGSAAFPSVLGRLVVINTGTNAVNICWGGGSCAATVQNETLAAGASDTVYLGGATTSPTAFSTSGTTLSIHN